MTRLHRIESALEELKSALKEEDIELKRLLVDKTLPLKYELSTGQLYTDEPRVPCDPFSSLCIAEITVVGQDNERLGNDSEWPEDEDT